ncbi:hypothetical protein L1987_60361 [Smallanthus sonchifolius]|uniref:Uncharacterized protein n=1 Tax=Smallanthus sonchifolius TaxID=185202 RepID=A0ACB9D7U3_9ASTR|nr:hypothetical protein L1987_60361 [Smallanthus sonchifolius]
MFVFPANSKRTDQGLLANPRSGSTVLRIDPFVHRKRDTGIRTSPTASFGGGSGVTPSLAVDSSPLYPAVLVISAKYSNPTTKTTTGGVVISLDLPRSDEMHFSEFKSC